MVCCDWKLGRSAKAGREREIEGDKEEIAEFLEKAMERERRR